MKQDNDKVEHMTAVKPDTYTEANPEAKKEFLVNGKSLRDGETEVVEPADNAEPVGDSKINLTINGQSMDGLDAEGEDVPEIRENRIDYSKYDNLTDLFAEGIQHFCYFISRDIPEELRKGNEGDTLDLHSSRHGVKALRTCMDLLNRQLKEGETGYQMQEDYDQLYDWYVDGIIDFMGMTLADMDAIPKSLLKEGDDNYPIECGIRALNVVRKKLLVNVKELMNVE